MGMYPIIFLATALFGLDENVKRILFYIALGVGIICIAFIFLCGIISIVRFVTKANKAIGSYEMGIHENPIFDNCNHGNVALESLSHITPSIPSNEMPIEEQINLENDLELVAVITAAIEAYEESNGNTFSTNGLIVRSIRKVNKSSWKNS